MTRDAFFLTLPLVIAGCLMLAVVVSMVVPS